MDNLYLVIIFSIINVGLSIFYYSYLLSFRPVKPVRPILLEQNSKPRQSVRIRPKRKRTVVLLKHFADKYQADTLTATFSGKERAEQLGLRFLVNTFTCVGDLQANRIMRSTDINLAIMVNRFGSVLDNVDQHLLEERIVQIDNRRNGIQLHHDPDIPVQTNRFHKTFA